MRYVYEVVVSCTSVQRVQVSAQKSIAVVKTKLELELHADTCVVGANV